MDRRPGQCRAEDARDVLHGLHRTGEDVVARADLIAYRAERQENVRGGLHELVVDAGQVQLLLREVLDLAGRDVGCVPGCLDDRGGLRPDDREVSELLDPCCDRRSRRRADEERAGRKGHGTEEPCRRGRGGNETSRGSPCCRLGVLDVAGQVLDRLAAALRTRGEKRELLVRRPCRRRQLRLRGRRGVRRRGEAREGGCTGCRSQP